MIAAIEKAKRIEAEADLDKNAVRLDYRTPDDAAVMRRILT